MSDFLDNVSDIEVEPKACTVRAACKANRIGHANSFQLDYTDVDGNEKSLLPPYESGDYTLRLMESLRPTAIFMDNSSQEDLSVELMFGNVFYNWWLRRAQTYGWLNDMLNRRDYDPLENYDRKEDGGWKDTTDVGARSASDILGATQETTTDTPSVTTTRSIPSSCRRAA